MNLSVPFYENRGDGSQCMQVAMKSVLKHFLDRDFSLEELDKLTGRKSELWTWIFQVVTALYDLGLKVKYYAKSDLEPFLEGEPFIRRNFGKDSEKIIKFGDIPALIESVKKLLNYDIFEKRKLSFDEIEYHIEQGHVPLLLIDHNKIVGKESQYQGHLVVVTGFDNQNVFYHESGPKNPKANKKVPKSTFIDAWNANGTGNSAVIVYGK
ncbi:MAG: hypothetical protein ABEI74_03545 [Candidatus Pacearchaeota archaeon]